MNHAPRVVPPNPALSHPNFYKLTPEQQEVIRNAPYFTENPNALHKQEFVQVRGPNHPKGPKIVKNPQFGVVPEFIPQVFCPKQYEAAGKPEQFGIYNFNGIRETPKKEQQEESQYWRSRQTSQNKKHRNESRTKNKNYKEGQSYRLKILT